MDWKSVADKFPWQRSAWVAGGVGAFALLIPLDTLIEVDARSLWYIPSLVLFIMLTLCASAGVMLGITRHLGSNQDLIRATIQVVVTYSLSFTLLALTQGDISISAVWWKAALGILFFPFLGLGYELSIPLLIIGLLTSAGVVVIQSRRAKHRQASLVQ